MRSCKAAAKYDFTVYNNELYDDDNNMAMDLCYDFNLIAL